MMPKFILDFVFALSVMSLITYYFYSTTNWKTLSKKYSIEKKYARSLFTTQELAYINEFAINELKIGVSSKGLFLSFPPLMGFIFSSILIPWSELTYKKDI